MRRRRSRRRTWRSSQQVWMLPAGAVLALTVLLAAFPRGGQMAPAAAQTNVLAPAKGAARPEPLLWYRNSTLFRTPQVVREWYRIGGVGVNVVWVDTAQPNVRCMVGLSKSADPRRGYFPREDFHRTIARYKPRAAINGTFFHKLNGQPTGSIVRNGAFLYDGRWGTTIAFDRQGRVRFYYRSGTYGRDFRWDPSVYQAITTGPTLIKDGRVWLHARAEGFKDPRVLGTARRSAIGLTWNNKLVLVTVHTPISLNKLANIMLRFSCKAAANLDGGSSSGLYCNGQFITKPSRRLSNVLLVYD